MAKPSLTEVIGDLLQRRAASVLEPEVTITYGDLAERTGLPPFRDKNWMAHPLSKILGELNEQDHAANRPFRSALVVNAESGVTGESFFNALAELRYSGAEVPAERKREFWIVERDLVVNYWRGNR